MEKGDRPVDFARLKVNTCLKYIVNEDESPHVLSYLGTSVIMCVWEKKGLWCTHMCTCLSICLFAYVHVSVVRCIHMYLLLYVCLCICLFVCVYYYMCVCIIIYVCVLLYDFISDEGRGWNDLT